MATFSAPLWTPSTAYEELQNRIATIEREIQRRSEDVESGERMAADGRATIAGLEALKVDYENVVMLAFSKSDSASAH